MPDSPYPKTGAGLQTVNDTGTAPRSRIDDFQSALTIVESLRKAAEARNLKAARIKGMFDGNPPYNPERQKQAGMKGYPNFNTLEGKAYLSSALVPYYDLFSSAPCHVEVELDVADSNLAGDWSHIVSEELHRTLTESTWFEMTVWKMLHDFVGFGKGFLVWPDPVTWRSRRVSWDRVWFPDATDADSDTWEYFAVMWHYDAHDLYRRVRNRQTAESAGWNADNVLRAIQSAARYDPSRLNDWLGIQRQLRDHDIVANAQCDKVVTAWLFVKEFDGRWSWMVVPITQLMDPGNHKVPAAQHGFLYKRTGIYASIDEVLAPFFFEVFDGSVNGMSGIGKDILAPMQLKDRMACAKVNNVFMRSSVLMQAKSGTGRQKAALAQIGNVCVIPEGYEVQQSTILGDIESTIAVGRDIDLMLQANTGIYRPQFEKPQGNPETATAATLRFQQGTILGNSAVNRFHRQLDSFYAELYRRLVKSGEKDARQFRSWCKQRGVPEAALSRTRSIRSYRNVGNGSAFLRQTNIASLAAFFQEFPEDGKRRFLEDIVAAYTGQQKVERYIKTEGAAGIPNRHVWEATQENAALKEAAPVVWTPQQEDITHLAVHAQALQQALSGVQQGGDPAAVAVFGQGIIQHAGAHIGALQRKGRKREVKQWGDIFKQLAQQVGTLSQQVQQRQQQLQMQQQKMQETMNDQQLKQMELSGKMQLAGVKTQHALALKDAKAKQDMTLADAETAARIHRDNAVATHDIARNHLTAAAKVEQSGAE